MIFGRPGSGKSTFADQLSKHTNIPAYHLDQYFYTKNWLARHTPEFLDLQQKLVNKNNWIIDGNDLKSLEMRYSQASLTIYFLLPRFTCLRWLIKRRFTKDTHLDNRALNRPAKISWKLIWYLWTFNWRAQKTVAKLRKQYPQVKFHLIKSEQDLSKLWHEIAPAQMFGLD